MDPALVPPTLICAPWSGRLSSVDVTVPVIVPDCARADPAAHSRVTALTNPVLHIIPPGSKGMTGTVHCESRVGDLGADERAAASRPRSRLRRDERGTERRSVRDWPCRTVP